MPEPGGPLLLTLGPLVVAVPARAADDSPASETSLVYVDQTDEHYGQIVVQNAGTGSGSG